MDICEFSRGQTSFADVLRTLAFHGKATLAKELREAGCFKEARLASRVLRDAIDCSTSDIRLRLNLDDKLRWAAGHLPPLRRWDALTDVVVDTQQYSAMDPSELGHSLSLPFLGQPTACLERIARLRIISHPSKAIPAAALSSLLHSLRGLRTVELQMVLVIEPLQQQILYHALAALPQLSCVELPSFCILGGIAVLANKLTRLVLQDDYSSYGSIFSNSETLKRANEVGTLAQLQSLRSLRLSLSHTESGTLRTLLNNLPANLELLELPRCRVAEAAAHVQPDAVIPLSDVSLQLCSGLLTSVRITGIIHLSALAGLAQELLSGCRALGPSLPLLEVQNLVVCSYGSQVAVLVTAVQPLLQRCAKVEVERLICVGPIPNDWARALEEVPLRMCDLLRMPQQLVLPAAMSPCFELRLRQHGGLSALRGGSGSGSGGSGADVGGVRPLPPAALVMDRALALLASTAAATHPCQGPLGGYAGQVHLVLLSGPFINALGWAPSALHAWMEQLAVEVDSRAALIAESSGGGAAAVAVAVAAAAGGHVLSYLRVPCSAAVLVECRTAFAAEVLRTTALDARTTVLPSDGPAALSAVPAAAVAMPRGHPVATSVRDAFSNAVNEVLQQFWDGTISGASEARERDRLWWALCVWLETCHLLATLSIAMNDPYRFPCESTRGAAGYC